MKKITIIGAGFAGLAAVRTLRKKDKTAQITLISPKSELVYMPSLIWVPSGVASGKDIIVPLDNFFERMNVRHVVGEAVDLEDGGRTVLLKNDARVDNDALIIASGGSFIKKLLGIEYAIIPCEGLRAAEQIRDRVKAMDGGNIAIGFAGNPKEPSAMRGGPMFEFLFGLDTQLRQQDRREQFE